jgi:hypothetical protein
MNANNVKLTFTYRPLSDTAMVWTDVIVPDDEREQRLVTRPVNEDMSLQVLKVGPAHNRTKLIFDGLQVISVSQNDGWDAFLGLMITDDLASLIVDKIKELRSLPVPIDTAELVSISHRSEADIDLTALVVSQ